MLQEHDRLGIDQVRAEPDDPSKAESGTGGHYGLRMIVVWTAVSLLITGMLALLARPPFNPDTACCDHLYYRSMSYNLFTVTRPDLNVPPPGNRLAKLNSYDPHNGLNRQPPYVYRVFTPLLARAFAYVMGINTAYYLITFLAFVGALLFIALSIYELTGAQAPAAAGVILFLVTPFTASQNLHHYMLTDPMAFFLTATAVWALITRKRALFFVVCAIGVLNKESMVPMLVAYPLSEAWIEHGVNRTSIAVAVGLGAGWYLFRRVIPIPDNNYSIVNQFSARLGLQHMVLMGRAGLVLFAAILPAALRRLWHSKLMVALAPFAIACVLEALFVDNLERAMVQALPVICVAVLWRWPPERRQQLLTLAFLPLAALSAIAYGIGGTHVRASWPFLFLTFICAAAAEVSLLRLQVIPSGEAQAA